MAIVRVSVLELLMSVLKIVAASVHTYAQKEADTQADEACAMHEEQNSGDFWMDIDVDAIVGQHEHSKKERYLYGYFLSLLIRYVCLAVACGESLLLWPSEMAPSQRKLFLGCWSDGFKTLLPQFLARCE